jgi:carbon storage regulator
MLVLSRKVGERIQLGDQITVTLVKIQGNTVRLGIEAPHNMNVVREELTKRSTDDAIAVSVVPEAAGSN